MFKLQYQNKDEAVVEEAEPIIDKLQVSHLVFLFKLGVGLFYFYLKKLARVS